MGRKLAMSVQFVMTFLGGMVYAFWSSWQTSLAVLAVAPFISLTAYFLVKVNTSSSARANRSFAKAGSIATASTTSIRTILAFNAVQIMIDRFQVATKEAYDGAVSQLALVGLANGSNLAAMLLSYVIITLFGSWLLYDQVSNNGCDPSGGVDGNTRCDPAGVDVFAALLGVSFAASVLPQISTTIETFIKARVACYPALAVINRAVNVHKKMAPKQGRADEIAMRRGGTTLPEYVIDSSSDTGMKPESVNGQVEFRNVCFRYPTRQESEVLNDFSLRLEPGTTVALIGASGSVSFDLYKICLIASFCSQIYDPSYHRASPRLFSLLSAFTIQPVDRSLWITMI